jgi:hypothetical protein
MKNIMKIKTSNPKQKITGLVILLATVTVAIVGALVFIHVSSIELEATKQNLLVAVMTIFYTSMFTAIQIRNNTHDMVITVQNQLGVIKEIRETSQKEIDNIEEQTSKLISANAQNTTTKIEALKTTSHDEIKNVITQTDRLIGENATNIKNQIDTIKTTSHDEIKNVIDQTNRMIGETKNQIDAIKTTSQDEIKNVIDQTNRMIGETKNQIDTIKTTSQDEIKNVNQQMSSVRTEINALKEVEEKGMETLNSGIEELSVDIKTLAENSDRKTDAIHETTERMAKSMEYQMDKIIENTQTQTNPLKTVILQERLEKITAKIEQRERALEYAKQERKKHETKGLLTKKEGREKRLAEQDLAINKLNKELSPFYAERVQITEEIKKIKEP